MQLVRVDLLKITHFLFRYLKIKLIKLRSEQIIIYQS